MTLAAFWFIVLVVLWTGFFLLEGFDFGVGVLHGAVGGDAGGRAAAVRTIGPVWDGNEVWLIVAVAVTFAAFPDWYATMLSGFYPVFVVVLVALILRGVSFAFGAHAPGERGTSTPGRSSSAASGTCSAPTRSRSARRCWCCTCCTARRSSPCARAARCAAGRCARAGCSVRSPPSRCSGSSSRPGPAPAARSCGRCPSSARCRP